MAVPELAGREQLTRRQLLQGAGAAALIAGVGASGIELFGKGGRLRRIPSYAVKSSGPVRAFHSRPDLRPPTVTIDDADHDLLIDHGPSPGYVFLGPGPVSLRGTQEYGPLIVDRRGEPVWFKPLAQGLQLANFAPATYRGEPVLTWWEGVLHTSGYGQGEAVIVDRGYRELARVRAANGRSMDLHGFCLTSEGTALFTCYPETVMMDLRPLGGPKRAPGYESTIQEVDVATGRLLFEWKSLEHIAVGDSYEPLGRQNFDYLHINSIVPTPDGQLLASGRHTWALYKLDRRTGEVIWTLGGKRTQFQMGSGAQFAWQHDARQASDGRITVFDNGTNGPIKSEQQSRGLVLDVDETKRTASLHRAYEQPKHLLASAMGSVQTLASGHVVVGWGTASHTSAFAADGTLLFDATLPYGTYSFRSSWMPWQSRARHPPAIAAGRESSSRRLIYASWNGATGVKGWRLDAGTSHDRLQAVGVAQRRGFETAIPVHPAASYVSVIALDRAGRALETSKTIRL